MQEKAAIDGPLTISTHLICTVHILRLLRLPLYFKWGASWSQNELQKKTVSEISILRSLSCNLTNGLSEATRFHDGPLRLLDRTMLSNRGQFSTNSYITVTILECL
jgi:hypothetical protein